MSNPVGPPRPYSVVQPKLSTLRASRRLNPHSRLDHSTVSSRFYTELDKYVATIITIFKNGDSWYPGHELRFLPGRDFRNLDGLFQKANERLDFLGGIKYMWDTEGVRVTSLDQVAIEQQNGRIGF